MTDAPIIVWFRRDLRLADHPALSAAADTGRPIIPLFIHDETVEVLGAAAKWRLGQGISALAGALNAKGARLILRRGEPLRVLRDLIATTGSGAVLWTRCYEGAAVARDTAVKQALKEDGVSVESFPGATVFEPWQVETTEGKSYSVFSPFWRSIRGRHVAAALPAPKRLSAPKGWPESDDLARWRMDDVMRRGADVVAVHACIGEDAAGARLEEFLENRLDDYRDARDFPARGATSGLSENLAWGEISPRTIWNAAMREREAGRPGAEKFLSELGWREFAWHLMFHAPEMGSRNWREDWDAFPWRGDNDDAERWRRGMTGEPIVDAAMREMYVTGRMHNRARMIVASYLTKHLMTDWRVGLRWFADCLTDWDPASNAMGWQWVAGSGPDAAPFFRIFNPRLQAERFDPDGAYRAAFLAEGQENPPVTARAYFDAVPKAWALSLGQPYPEPLVDLRAGRVRALAAYKGRNSAPAK